MIYRNRALAIVKLVQANPNKFTLSEVTRTAGYTGRYGAAAYRYLLDTGVLEYSGTAKLVTYGTKKRFTRAFSTLRLGRIGKEKLATFDVAAALPANR